LEINVNHFTVLVYRAPKIMLPAVDLYEDFIDVEGVTESLMSSFQSTGINRPKLDAPEPDGFPGDSDASLSK